MKTNTILGVMVFFLSIAGRAQSLDTLSGTTKSEIEIPLESNHWYSSPMLIGGLKSTNSLGRVSQIQSIKSRDQIFIGSLTPKGWGFYVTGGYTIGSGGGSHSHSGGSSSATTLAKTNSQQKRKQLDSNTAPGPAGPADTEGIGMGALNRTGFQDPELALLHPVYNSEGLTISGQFKESFPVSDMSRTNHSWTEGYYSSFLFRLPHRFHLSNILSVRYHSRDSYEPPYDAVWSMGVSTSLVHKLNNWCRVGGGERVQADIHQSAPVGDTLELFILADFILAKHLIVGPRVHFPVAAQNSVFSDTPTTPSTSNIQAEIYLQSTL